MVPTLILWCSTNMLVQTRASVLLSTTLYALHDVHGDVFGAQRQLNELGSMRNCIDLLLLQHYHSCTFTVTFCMKWELQRTIIQVDSEMLWAVQYSNQMSYTTVLWPGGWLSWQAASCWVKGKGHLTLCLFEATSSRKRSRMACAVVGSHSFICHPRVHPHMERTNPHLPSQPKLVLICRQWRDERLSPGLRAYCFAELAVFSSKWPWRIASTQWLIAPTHRRWSGWLGLSGWTR